MENFWDYNVWGTINLLLVLLLSLICANMLKRSVRFLEDSLIPTSVLGGALLLVVAGIYNLITDAPFFDAPFFGGHGTTTLEIITYHTLALGFIASTFKSGKGKLTKQRTVEIFNTGVNTVSTYLLQAVVGFGITLIAAMVMKDFFSAAGVLLPFGFGQGTGQAMNYGGIYENQFGFDGGKSFGLTVAALGFISASVGGVVHLNILKRQGKIKTVKKEESAIQAEEIQGENEIPMQGSMDKLTVQLALVAGAYMLTYLLMYLLGLLLPGMRAVIYGFNFLLGVLTATLIKVTVNALQKKRIINRQYVNDFLMTRCSNFFYDIMVVAGIAAIRLGILQKYWGILLILGVVGLFITYFYNRLTAKVLFPAYEHEQFLTMYGMLTGTASTGVILLREIDGEFETPAADNLVYQNFPAIVFGFPMMLLATLAPQKPMLTWIILLVFFAVMNIILFRSVLFKKKSK
jgi:ESS family glutamate:Na+ symporter